MHFRVAKRGVIMFNQWIGGQRTDKLWIILIDVSGSMSFRISTAVQVLKRLLLSLKNGKVLLIKFSTQASLLAPITSVENIESILPAVDSITVDGSTNIADGIKLAADSIVGNFQNISVTIITDGESTDGDPVVAIKNLKRKYPRCKVYTYLINPTPYGKEMAETFTDQFAGVERIDQLEQSVRSSLSSAPNKSMLGQSSRSIMGNLVLILVIVGLGLILLPLFGTTSDQTHTAAVAIQQEAQTVCTTPSLTSEFRATPFAAIHTLTPSTEAFSTSTTSPRFSGTTTPSLSINCVDDTSENELSITPNNTMNGVSASTIPLALLAISFGVIPFAIALLPQRNLFVQRFAEIVFVALVLTIFAISIIGIEIHLLTWFSILSLCVGIPICLHMIDIRLQDERNKIFGMEVQNLLMSDVQELDRRHYLMDTLYLVLSLSIFVAIILGTSLNWSLDNTLDITATFVWMFVFTFSSVMLIANWIHMIKPLPRVSTEFSQGRTGALRILGWLRDIFAIDFPRIEEFGMYEQSLDLIAKMKKLYLIDGLQNASLLIVFTFGFLQIYDEKSFWSSVLLFLVLIVFTLVSYNIGVRRTARLINLRFGYQMNRTPIDLLPIVYGLICCIATVFFLFLLANLIGM